VSSVNCLKGEGDSLTTGNQWAQDQLWACLPPVDHLHWVRKPHDTHTLAYETVNSIPRQHAPVAQSLLDAGMISTQSNLPTTVLANHVVLGKSNMTALGNNYQNGIPNGWSPWGGQVISPFGKGLETGGSSTGSAVALAAGMTAAAIGAESFGSIVSISL
jgi:Asp-tRNA(Asn)/Glu-tRNA(Gln) amidotransferase A subunit family amidase